MNGQQDRRLWVGAGALATVVLVVVAWLLAIAPQRSAVETLRSDTEAVELSNSTLAARTAQLRQEAEGRDALTASLRTALTALPADDDLPEFSLQLSRQAKARGVDLTSIVVGSATTPGATAVAVAPADGTADGTEDGTAAVAVATTARAVPVTLVSTGAALQQLYFLRDIQQVGPRRALVTSTSIVPLGEDAIDVASTMTIQLTVFSTPLSEVTLAQLADVLGDDSG